MRPFLVVIWLVVLLTPSMVNAAAPTAEMVLTTGVSANLKPRNDLAELPLAAGKLTVYLKWKNLAVKKKWGFINDSDPVTFKARIFDGKGKLILDESQTFTPDAADTVTWVEHKFKPGTSAGQWNVVVDVFGRQLKKAIRIY